MEDMTEEELKAIASQLRCPDGEMGVEIGNMMNDSNIAMTLKAIETLDLADHDEVFELGHGNCRHLPEILGKAVNIKYTGLDISELMNIEAKKINAGYIETGVACYYLYDGNIFPFSDDHFDKVFTVNTIYFWKNPVDTLNEIHRVMRSGGIFSLAFAQAESMRNLPFVKYGFEMYDTGAVLKLLEKTSFNIINIEDISEKVEAKTGDIFQRDSTVITAEK